MPACSACTNRPSTKSKRQQDLEVSGLKITFHRIPKNAELRKLWIQAVRRKDWLPTNNSVLCSMHFKEEDFDRSSLSVVRLRENAVPSVFKAFPSYLQAPKQLKRKSEVVGSSSYASHVAETHQSDFPSTCAASEGAETVTRSTSVSPESKRKKIESPTKQVMRDSFKMRQLYNRLTLFK